MCTQRATDFAISGPMLSILVKKKAFVKLNFSTALCIDFSTSLMTRGMVAKVSGNVFLGFDFSVNFVVSIFWNSTTFLEFFFVFHTNSPPNCPVHVGVSQSFLGETPKTRDSLKVLEGQKIRHKNLPRLYVKYQDRRREMAASDVEC